MMAFMPQDPPQEIAIAQALERIAKLHTNHGNKLEELAYTFRELEPVRGPGIIEEVCATVLGYPPADVGELVRIVEMTRVWARPDGEQ